MMRWKVVLLVVTTLAIVCSGAAFGQPIANSDLLEFKLQGDGVRTDRVKFQITNKSEESLTFTIPKFTVFKKVGSQSIMLLSDKELTIRPRKTATTTLATMCVGKRAETPPGESATYTAHQDPEASTQVGALFQRAEEKHEGGYFPPLPLLPAQQIPTVVQLAFWQQSEGLTKDEMKAEVIRQLELDPTALTPEEEEEVEEGSDNIWEAVNLCQKD